MNLRSAAIDAYLIDRSRDNRDAVISEHMYLCKRGARKFRRTASDAADLEQVAAIGLVKATDAYLPERTTPFEAYAWIVIIGELMHYVRDCEQAVRVPRRLRALDRRYVATWETLAAELHAEPTPAQLADALGVGIDAIGQIQALRRSQSVDAFETLPAPARGLAIEDRVTLTIAVDDLIERERAIVLGTYGAGLSQAEVARMLGLSQSQVSKLLARALGKLSKKVA